MYQNRIQEFGRRGIAYAYNKKRIESGVQSCRTPYFITQKSEGVLGGQEGMI